MHRTVRETEATEANQRATPARRAELPARVIATLAALGLILLIVVGSRGLHDFDSELIGYAVITFFAVAALGYRYTL